MKIKFYALWLSLICILVLILQYIIPGFTDLFILNQQSFIQPWRFVTSIFLHGGVAHLALNLFALALFGTILESLIGSRRFLYVFFASGIVANVIAINFYDSSLGASGAIFGVIGALVAVRPLLTVWAFGLPMPMFVAGIIWAVGDSIGALTFLAGNPMDNTGNIAHLSGIGIGLLMGLWSRRGMPRASNSKERIEFNEEGMRSWEDFYMK